MNKSKRFIEIIWLLLALVGLNYLSVTVVSADVELPVSKVPLTSAASYFNTGAITTTLTPDFTFTGQNCPECLGADISIHKSDGTTLTPKGGILAYTLTYENQGIDDLTGVIITETVPFNTTFAPTLSSNGWQQIGSSNIYIYNLGRVEKDESGSLIFAVTMDNVLPPGVETITNTVVIGDNGLHGPDKTPDNNSSTDVNFIINEPSTVCGTISEDTVWSPFGSPYVVTCDIVVPAGVTLSLLEGTVVRFDQNTGFRVSGSLIAEGTSATHIMFEANSGGPGRGYWDGIDIFAGGQAIIRHAEFANGGSTSDSYDATIYALDDSLLTVENSIIDSSNSRPIRAGNSAVSIINNSGSNNASQSIWVNGTYDQDATLGQNLDLPFVLDSVTVAANNTLTVGDGAIFKFNGTNSRMNIFGTMNVQGTAVNQAVFTSIREDAFGGDTDGSNPGLFRGLWDTIAIRNGGTATIDYATFRWGGDEANNSYDSVLYVEASGSLTMRNSSIRHSDTRGVQNQYGQLILENNLIANLDGRGLQLNMNSNTPPPLILNNTFNSSNGHAAVLSFTDTAVGTFSGNTGSGNDTDGFVLNGNLVGNGRWQTNDNFPYVVDELTIAANSELVIDPGVIVKFFDTDSSIDIFGTLVSEATATNPIIYTSIREDAFGGDTDNSNPGLFKGLWDYIAIRTGGEARFRHNQIRYGGDEANTTRDTTLYVEAGGRLIMNNVNVRFSDEYGIRSFGELYIEDSVVHDSDEFGISISLNPDTPPPTLLNNTFTSNGWSAVNISYNNAAQATFSGNTGATNGKDAVRVSGTINGQANWNTNINFPFLITELTIAPTSTLTIDPDVVVKFDGTDSDLFVDGTLKAIGTASEEIIFTSVREDAFGGDTDNTNPGLFRGLWDSITIRAGGVAHFDHAQVRYGGDEANTSADSMIWLQRGGVLTFTNSIINHSDGHGIRSNNGRLYVENSQFIDHDVHGITYNVDPTTPEPIIRNNTFTSIRSRPIRISYSSADMGIVTGNGGSGNNTNGIYVTGTIVGDARWRTNNNFPYVTPDFTIAQSSTLTVDPGVIVKFDNTDSDLIINGRLNALGTPTEQIIFTSVRDDSFGGDTDASNPGTFRGLWDSIQVLNGATAHFDYTHVRFGGDEANTTLDSSIYIQRGGTLTFTNSILNHSDVYGIRSSNGRIYVEDSEFRNHDDRAITVGVDATTPEPIIRNNTFTNINTRPIQINYSNTDVGLITNNGGNGNGIDGIYVTGTIAGDARWRTNNNFPYVFPGFTVAASSTLTIDPGVVLKATGADSNFTVNGTLKAIGQAGNEIVFTSIRDDSFGGDTDNSNPGTFRGLWETMRIFDGGTAHLDHVRVRFAGDEANNDYDSSIYVQRGATLTLTNAIINHGDTYGIWGHYGRLFIKDSTIKNHDAQGVRLFVDANTPEPIVRDNTFNSNGNYAGTIFYNNGAAGIIENNGGNGNSRDGFFASGTFNNGHGRWYTNNNLPYIIDNFTIAPTGTLTIDPDVVVKFLGTDSNLFIDGNLYAQGRPGHRITFTTIREDSFGGDTDNSNPGLFRGLWDSIAVRSGGTAVFDFTNVRYGGDEANTSRDAMIHLAAGGTLTVTDSFIGHSDTVGLRIFSADHFINGNRFFVMDGNAVTNGDIANIIVDARNNWWGNASGPSHSSNPGGTGEPVSNGVRFDPWRTVAANMNSDVQSGIAPLEVAFTNNSTASAWVWDFGDGITSTQEHPTHTYTIPGTYTITLTASDAITTDVRVYANYITVIPVTSQNQAVAIDDVAFVTPHLNASTAKFAPHKSRLFAKLTVQQTITQTLPPPLPSSFYGTVTVEGQNVPTGTLVTALINGVPYANTPVYLADGQSVYSLDALGDITDTAGLEGGSTGDTIVFKIGDSPANGIGGANADQTAVWQFGTYENLDLTTFYGTDLVVRLAAQPTAVAADDLLNYTLTITNIGPGTANGVYITTQLADDVSFTIASDGGVESNGTILWPLISLAEGQAVQRTFGVQANSTFPTGVDTIDHVTQVTYDGTNGLDPTPQNNKAVASAILNAFPNLQISQQSTVSPVTPGETFQYTLLISNTGTQAASNVLISDTLPSHTLFLNASNSGIENDGVVTWFPFTVAATTAVSRTISLQLLPLPTLPPTATIITNRASVTDDNSNGADLNPADNNSLLATPILRLPDLIVANLDLSSTNTAADLTLSGPISATIQNSGNDDALPPFQLTLFADNDDDSLYTNGIDTLLGQTAFASTVSISQTAVFPIPVSGTVQFRDDHVYAFVDSLNQVAELYENNNIYNTATACQYVPTVGDFSPVVELSWPQSGIAERFSKDSISTPLVVNLTDDNNDGEINDEDTPDIVFVTADLSYEGFDPPPVMLRAIKGDTGESIFDVPQFYQFGITSIFLYSLSGMAAGDIDNDGKPEIVMSAIVVNIHPFAFGVSNRLIAFEHTGARKWISPEYSTHPTGSSTNRDNPTLADIDGNGTVEIVVGGIVFNRNGSVRWRGLAGQAYQSARNANKSDSGAISVVADLDMDGSQEIIAGNTAYRADGSIYWQVPYDDGYPAIANFDSDDSPEIVVVARGSVRLQNHDGSLIWGPHDLPGSDPNAGGAPTVADFDADGQPEIGVAASDRYVVYETDGSLKWQTNTQDNSSNMTGSTVFDLDGDGNFEVIYRDERALRIYDGRNGQVLFEELLSSFTQNEEVVVADIDKDGNAEIIVSTDRARKISGLPRRSFGIRVYGDANDNWVAARSIWNQHAYHIDNVNDDGTIPVAPAYSWLTHNTFRANVGPTTELDVFAAPDLTATILDVDLLNHPQATITARIGNGGAIAAPANTPIAFFADGILASSRTLGTLLQPGAFVDLTFNATLSGFTAGSFTVAADDDGTSQGRHGECREDNNSDSFNYDSSILGLIVTKTDGETRVAAGQTLTYTINVVNAFNNVATGIRLTDTLPTNTTFITASQAFTVSGTITDGFTITWPPFSVAASGTATRTVTVQVNETLPLTAVAITNSVRVTDDGSNGPDLILVNNEAVDVDTLSTVRAVTGGPYSGAEGEPILLDGSASFDRDGTIVAYQWDFDNDGQYDDATGVTTTAVFPDNGTFPIGLRVVDNDGESDTDSTVANTTNLTPTVTAAADPVFVEGIASNVTLASYSDNGSDDTHTAIVTWGDGSVTTNTVTGGNVQLSHIYIDNGNYPIEVCVRDDDAAASCAILTAIVNNLPPVVEAGPDTSAEAGETVSLAPATFSDSGSNDTHIATVDWGDGTVVTTTVTESNGSGTVAASHAYAVKSVYQVEVCVIDNDGAFGCDSFIVNLVDVAVSKDNDLTGVRPGDTFTYTILVSNTGTIDLSGVVISDTLPAHTSFVTTDGNGNYNAVAHRLNWFVGDLMPGQAATRTVTLLADAAPPAVAVRITNTVTAVDDGSNGPDMRPANNTFTETDKLLSVTAHAGGPYNGNEGEPILLDASATTDRNGIIVSYEWDIDNDGDFDDATGVTTTVIFGDDGTFIIRLRATDDTGESDIAVATATLLNQAPTIQAFTAPTFVEGDTVSQLLATFVDLGSNDTHTATVNWMDGTIDPGILTESEGSGSIFGNHRYLDDGNYPVEICVQDDEGATACTTLNIIVENSLPFLDTTRLSDLRLWSDDVLLSCFDPFPHWQIAADGTTVTQTLNSRPSVFYGSFSPFDTRVEGRVKVFSQTVTTTVPFIDDDYFGFVLGYRPDDLNTNDADYLLIDWKGGQAQSNNFGCGGPTTATPGLAVSRITGSPADAEMWGHTDYGCNGNDNRVVELGRASTLGNSRWDYNTDYDFGIELSATRLQVFVNDNLEIDVTGDFASMANGRFGFYTYSQPNVVFQNFNFESITVDEGTALNLESDFSDLGVLDTHTAVLDWGDGVVITGSVIEANGAGTLFGNHTYVDGDNDYTLQICLSDDDGGTKCNDIGVRVRNVTPAVAAGPDVAALAGQVISVTAVFTDPGTLDTHTATVKWGDGTVVTGTITETNGSGLVLATHSYSVNGVYTSEVCVTDKDGATGCDTFQVNSIDLQISKSDGQNIAVPGETLTYTVRVQNNSTLTVTHVNIGDILPEHTIFVAASGGGSYDAPAHVVVWDIPAIGAGDTLSRTVTVRLATLLPDGVDVITNTVLVSDDGSQGLEQTPADNIDSDVNLIPEPPTAAFVPAKILNAAQGGDGATITASTVWSSSSSYRPENAIDASSSSLWRSGSGQVMSQTLTVALIDGQPHVIDTVSILAGTGDAVPRNIEIRTSTDGVNFTTVTTGTVTQSGMVQPFTFVPVAATHIQLFIRDNYGNASYIQVNDLNALTRDRLGGIVSLLEGGASIAAVSSEDGSNPANNVIDFDNSNFWQSANGNLNNQWIKLDLVGDESLFINQIQLQSVNNNSSVDQFQVRVSDTGLADGDFETIFFGELPQDGRLHRYTFTPVRAKYVQLYLVNNHGNLTYMRLQDVQIYTTQLGGGTVPFDNFSTGVDSHIVDTHWEFGDGVTSTETHPVHSYADAGTYTITLTITDSNTLRDQATLTYTVLPPPTAVFTWTPVLPAEAQSTTFTDLSTAALGSVIVAREWQFSHTGSQPTTAATNTSFNDNGTYTATINVMDSQLLTATVTNVLTVTNLPPTANAGSDQTRTTGQSWSLDSSVSDPSSVDAGSLTCDWDFGDGQTAQVLNCTNSNARLSHSYAAGGVYTATLTVTDKDGASDSDTLIATINKRDTRTFVYAALALPGNMAEVRVGLFDLFNINTSMAGKALTITTNSLVTTTVVNTDGVAIATLPLSVGQQVTITATFAGDAAYHGSTVTKFVQVLPTLPKAEVVFMIDESGSMGGDIAEVRTQINTIARQLGGGLDFRLGLVGFGDGTHFGAAYSGGPHIHRTFTDDIAAYSSALNGLVASGGFEPGFSATILAMDDAMGYREDSDGVCAIIVTDEDADIRGSETRSVALSALQSRNAIFFGIVHLGSGNTANDYGPNANSLSAQTGGAVFSITSFRQNSTPVLTAILNDCATAVLENAPPDLAVAKTDNQTTVNAGELLTYTLTITNNSVINADAVLLTDTLPVATTFVTASDGGVVLTATHVVTWPLFSLNTGATITRSVTVRVAEQVSAGIRVITNTVVVTPTNSERPDNEPSDNVAIDETVVLAAPDLQIGKSYHGITPTNGSVIPYQLSFSNGGTQAATGVIISETVPMHTSFNAASSDPGWQCADGSPAGTVCTLAVGTVTITPVTITFAVTVSHELSRSLTVTNTVIIADDGLNGTDLMPNDNVTQLATFVFVNQPPIARDDAAVMAPATVAAPNTAVTLTLLANDSDGDGDGLTVVGTTQPFTGTAVLNGDGSVTYTPPLSFTGFVTFTYRISDAVGATDRGLVEILVADVMRVNFQRPESDTPVGYLADGGHAYGWRDNGLVYGWIDPLTGLPADNTVNARDRDWFNIPPDQRYDTFNHMQTYGAFIWETAVPDGWYLVYVVAGDPEYRNGIYRLDVEGVLTVDGQPNKGQYWIAGTSVVPVTDGRLTIGNNPAATGNNKLAFVHITPLGQTPLGGFTANINFQPSDAIIPAGYAGDFGNLFGERGNTLIYGWDIDVTDRARDRNIPDVSLDQRYDTLIQMQFGPTATWEIVLPNGIYMVRLVNGDSRYFIDHTYETDVEGVIVSGGEAVPVNRLRAVESSVIVAVNDGRLTVSSGPNAARNKVQFIEIRQIGR